VRKVDDREVGSMVKCLGRLEIRAMARRKNPME
jgi:hypothetical protein